WEKRKSLRKVYHLSRAVPVESAILCWPRVTAKVFSPAPNLRPTWPGRSLVFTQAIPYFPPCPLGFDSSCLGSRQRPCWWLRGIGHPRPEKDDWETHHETMDTGDRGRPRPPMGPCSWRGSAVATGQGSADDPLGQRRHAGPGPSGLSPAATGARKM